MLIDSGFDADVEYNTIFEPINFFAIEYDPQNDQKREKWYPEYHVVKYMPCDQ